MNKSMKKRNEYRKLILLGNFFLQAQLDWENGKPGYERDYEKIQQLKELQNMRDAAMFFFPLMDLLDGN